MQFSRNTLRLVLVAAAGVIAGLALQDVVSEAPAANTPQASVGARRASGPATAEAPGNPIASPQALINGTRSFWQLRSVLNCDSNNFCRTNYSAIPSGYQLEIEYVSCFMSSTNSNFSVGLAAVGWADVFSSHRHSLLPRERTAAGFSDGYLVEISQEVNIAVPAGRIPQVGLVLRSPPNIFPSCTISGEIVRL